MRSMCERRTVKVPLGSERLRKITKKITKRGMIEKDARIILLAQYRSIFGVDQFFGVRRR